MRVDRGALLQSKHIAQVHRESFGVRLRRRAQPKHGNQQFRVRRRLDRLERQRQHHEGHLLVPNCSAIRDRAQVVHGSVLDHALRHRLHKQLSERHE